jgi:SAM-dependent methyltransferase
MDAVCAQSASVAWSSDEDRVGAQQPTGGARWRNPRAALRDPMLVERILARHAVRPSLRPILDAPCGTGRLRGVLERRGLRYVGVDTSPSCLQEASAGTTSGLVRAGVGALPFRDDSFDVVVCCRFLHHLHDEGELELAVGELVRVAHRLVIASFWDSASLHAWRRRVGLRRGEAARARRAISKRELRARFDAAGAQVIGFHHSFRFVSQQTFAVAAKRVPVEARERDVVDLRTRILDLTLDRSGGSLGQAPV